MSNFKIYTRRGDDGNTDILGGKRLKKDDFIFDVLSKIDELNVAIGNIEDPYHKDLQRLLIAISGGIQIKKYSIDFDFVVQEMEEKIDQITDSLPKLTKFILFGSNPVEQHCHKCRILTRNVERMLVFLDVDKKLLKFFNRLSDYWFTIGRMYSDESNPDVFESVPDKYKIVH